MPRALIAYFSQAGSTARVAAEIARGLEEGGLYVDLLRIETGVPSDIDGYDIIGIGFPVYFFRVPFLVRDFIKKLPDLGGKPFFVFALRGIERGRAGNNARRLLAKKGGREVGFVSCFGADYWLGYLKRGYLASADHPAAEELAGARSFGRGIDAVGIPEASGRPRPRPGLLVRAPVNGPAAGEIFLSLFLPFEPEEVPPVRHLREGLPGRQHINGRKG